MTTTTVDGDCDCKIGRGIATFGLTGINEDLVHRWTGEGGDRQSLRALATHYNRALLDAALRAAGESPLDGEVANAYRLLTADDVSSGVRTQTRRRLAADGVPVDEVESAFVSHQTVHTHLTDCLDVSRDAGDVDPDSRRQSDRDRIRALQSRTEAVASDSLERLRGSDALDIGEFNVLVDVTVLCDECGRQHDVGSLLDQGGCGCRDGSSD